MNTRFPRIRLLLSLASLSSCVDKDGGGHGMDSGDLADGGDDGACVVDAMLFSGFEPSISPIPTVLRVNWATSSPARVRVSYEAGEGRLTTDWSESEVGGDIAVLGLPSNQQVNLRLETVVDGETRCSPTQAVTTGSLGLTDPTLTTLVADAVSPGFTAVAMLGDGRAAATILDQRGRFVWAQPAVGLSRARFSRDRLAVLYNTNPSSWDAMGTLVRQPLNGDPGTTFQVPTAHTDFVELPDGTLAVLGGEMREYEGGSRRILGQTVIEVAPDGTTRQAWSVFDHFEPDLDHNFEPGPLDDGLSPALEDWSHLNGLSYDEASGDYVISSSFNHGVLRVDRESAALVWSLSQVTAPTDFTVVSEVDELAMPHSAQLVAEDRVLVFNRGHLQPGGTGDCSWVTELQLDTIAATATPVWHWSSDDCVTVGFLGQAHRLPDGHTLTFWSSAGRITETDASGQLVWQVDMPLGTAFGFGDRVDSLYGPGAGTESPGGQDSSASQARIGAR